MYISKKRQQRFLLLLCFQLTLVRDWAVTGAVQGTRGNAASSQAGACALLLLQDGAVTGSEGAGHCWSIQISSLPIELLVESIGIHFLHQLSATSVCCNQLLLINCAAWG